MKYPERLVVIVVALAATTNPIAFAQPSLVHSSSQIHGPASGITDDLQGRPDDIGEQKDSHPKLDREPEVATVFIILQANISRGCLEKCSLDVLQPGCKDVPVTSKSQLYHYNAVELSAWPAEIAAIRVSCEPLCTATPSTVSVKVPSCPEAGPCPLQNRPLERLISVAEVARTTKDPPFPVYTWLRIGALTVIASAGHALIALKQSGKFR